MHTASQAANGILPVQQVKLRTQVRRAVKHSVNYCRHLRLQEHHVHQSLFHQLVPYLEKRWVVGNKAICKPAEGTSRHSQASQDQLPGLPARKSFPARKSVCSWGVCFQLESLFPARIAISS